MMNIFEKEIENLKENQLKIEKRLEKVDERFEKIERENHLLTITITKQQGFLERIEEKLDTVIKENKANTKFRFTWGGIGLGLGIIGGYVIPPIIRYFLGG